MDIQRFEVAGPLLITPRVFGDDRGHFFESFNQSRFDAAAGGHVAFVQDNESMSIKGTLRGLHYQLDPKAQGKLVRVVRGAVWDVAVDIRRASPTFGQYVAAELSADNHHQLWIPPGFAHGFIALTDQAVFQYKVTEYWSRDHERCIAWDDPDLKLPWPLGGKAPLVSEKDAQGTSFADAECFD